MLWFDLDNSPHVPLFRPIFTELERRGIPFDITARDFAQTKSLLSFWDIQYTLIGEHAGKNKIKKILNLYARSQQLKNHVKNKNISLAISHGSRSQVIAARRLSFPSVLMLDYEYTESRIFNLFSTFLLIPELIPDARLEKAGFNLRKVIRYSGYKEEIYLQNFIPQNNFRKIIDIDDEKILITIRPPSIVGNYHDSRSEKIFARVIDLISSHSNVHCLIVSRISNDLNLIPAHIRKRENISFLNKPVDGLQLLWNSDIVISGGGTMNREAALLGIPTFSIFTGHKPYLDEHLEQQGKIIFLNNSDEADKIQLKKRDTTQLFQPTNKYLVQNITDTIIDLSKRKL